LFHSGSADSCVPLTSAMFISWLGWSASDIADCFVIFPEKVPELEGMASPFLSFDDFLVNRGGF
jgi:hypothetical protein